MNFLEAIILGLIQGLTEFLPISSSAHLRIVGEILPSASDPGAAFTAITQIGTEAAVVVYFWSDIRRILSAWSGSLVGKVSRSHPDARMGWLIIVGSLPIVVLGLVFQEQIETTLRSLWIVAAMLVGFGVVLWLADRFGQKSRSLQELNLPHGLALGFAQALALIPGVSRSGGTITAGLILGYSRQAAARYAFLLALPAVFGSGLYQLFKSRGESGVFGPIETLAATVVAFVVGLAVISFLMRWLSSRTFLPFVIYRIVLGIVVLILLASGTISA